MPTTFLRNIAPILSACLLVASTQITLINQPNLRKQNLYTTEAINPHLMAAYGRFGVHRDLIVKHMVNELVLPTITAEWPEPSPSEESPHAYLQISEDMVRKWARNDWQSAMVRSSPDQFEINFQDYPAFLTLKLKADPMHADTAHLDQFSCVNMAVASLFYSAVTLQREALSILWSFIDFLGARGVRRLAVKDDALIGLRQLIPGEPDQSLEHLSRMIQHANKVRLLNWDQLIAELPYNNRHPVKQKSVDDEVSEFLREVKGAAQTFQQILTHFDVDSSEIALTQRKEKSTHIDWRNGTQPSGQQRKKELLMSEPELLNWAGSNWPFVAVYENRRTHCRFDFIHESRRVSVALETDPQNFGAVRIRTFKAMDRSDLYPMEYIPFSGMQILNGIVEILANRGFHTAILSPAAREGLLALGFGSKKLMDFNVAQNEKAWLRFVDEGSFEASLSLPLLDAVPDGYMALKDYAVRVNVPYTTLKKALNRPQLPAILAGSVSVPMGTQKRSYWLPPPNDSKAAYVHDEFVESDDSISLWALAKSLGIPPNTLLRAYEDDRVDGLEVLKRSARETLIREPGSEKRQEIQAQLLKPEGCITLGELAALPEMAGITYNMLYEAAEAGILPGLLTRKVKRHWHFIRIPTVENIQLIRGLLIAPEGYISLIDLQILTGIPYSSLYDAINRTPTPYIFKDVLRKKLGPQQTEYILIPKPTPSMIHGVRQVIGPLAHLYRWARRGNQNALAILVEMHSKFIWKIIHEVIPMHFRTSDNDDDLFQEGRMGLLIALRRFDPSKGTFLTIARSWVLAKLNRWKQHRSDGVRLAFNVQWDVRRVARFVRITYGFNHTLDENIVRTKLKENGFSDRAIEGYLHPPQTISTNGHAVAREIVERNPNPEQAVLNREKHRQIQNDLMDMLSTVLLPNEIDILSRRLGLFGRERQTHIEIIQECHINLKEFTRICEGAIEKLSGGNSGKADAMRAQLGKKIQAGV